MPRKDFHIIRQQKSSKSFYSALLLSFLLTAVASTLILAVFLTATYTNSGLKNTRDYNQKLLSQTNYTINQMNENVERLSITLLTNQRTTAFMSLPSMDSAYTIPVLASIELNKLIMALPYVENIHLYNSQIDLVYSSKTGYQQSLEDFEDGEIREKLSDKSFSETYDRSPVPGHFSSEDGKCEIFSYYIFDRHSENEGRKSAIVINVYASTLTDSIRSMKGHSSDTDTNFILLDENKSFLTGVLDEEFSGKASWLAPVQDSLSEDTPTGSSFLEINGKHYFQTYTRANENNWYLVNFIPIGVFLKKFITTALFGCVVLVIVLCLAFAICLYFSKKLNRPVQSITDMLKKQGVKPASGSSDPEEFQMILSGLQSLQENNQALRSMQKQTRYSLTQSCLDDLVTNVQTDSPQLQMEKLTHLGLTYLKDQKLCMAVIKVDRYRKFLNSREPDELWALRFSVVNITEEIVSGAFPCNAFSRDNDKFVLLINLGTEDNASNLEETLPQLLKNVQDNIHKFLNFTVTVTYSPVFQGIDNLPLIYKNLESALNFKMRYGHNALISPLQAEEDSTETFHMSSKVLYPLIDKLAEGQLEETCALYKKLTQNLYLCNYDEITSTNIHLLYTVYERLAEKYPMLKDSFTARLKKLLSELEYMETAEDTDALFLGFFEEICTSIQKLKEDPANENTSVIAQKVVKIIQEEYSNPALCLCSIADEIGLSQNYTGHLFKQVMQKSVAQYILDLRMEKLAYYLQNTDLPVNKILDDIGMEKNNYFYTRFKKYFGMSLGEYRAQFRTPSNTKDGQDDQPLVK